MAELTIPPSIDDQRSLALLELIERLDVLDLTPMLVYRIDSVPDSALAFLAWQFDIVSPLWQLLVPSNASVDALTDIDALVNVDMLTEGAPDTAGASAASAAQRALLKTAIQLHRYRGTPWAIKTALAALGWSNVTLLEGQSSWGGTAYPASQGWAVFRVVIGIGMGQFVGSNAPATIGAVVNFFKPARAWLDSVWFALTPLADSAPSVSDKLTLEGVLQYQLDTVPVARDSGQTLSVTGLRLADAVGPVVPQYNGQYAHSGITYGADEPAVADRALILNGVAVLQGG
jgi:P2-related tail formation protein